MGADRAQEFLPWSRVDLANVVAIDFAFKNSTVGIEADRKGELYLDQIVFDRDPLTGRESGKR